LIDDIIKTIVEFNKEYTKQNLENKLVEAQQIKWTKIKTNELNTLCNQCHNNCHIDCKLEIIENNNKDKFKSCKAFYSRWFISPWKSYCDTNCKCHYNYHNHELYKWIRGVDEDNILKLKKELQLIQEQKLLIIFKLNDLNQKIKIIGRETKILMGFGINEQFFSAFFKDELLNIKKLDDILKIYEISFKFNI